MTPEQLNEIEARANAATPGPWEPGAVWSMAGVIFDAHHDRVGEEKGTHCANCRYGEPTWAGRANINGTVMQAHQHRDPDPYAPEHLISSADGGMVAGNFDYEAGGILRAEDTEFVVHAREDVPALLAEVKRLQAARDEAFASNTAAIVALDAHVDEVKKLQAAKRVLLRSVETLTADRDRAREIAVALEQENARVRALHSPLIKEADDGEKIIVCLSCDGLRESCSDEAEPESWPCATIRAMGAGEASC